MVIQPANDPTHSNSLNEVSSFEQTFTLPPRKNRGNSSKRYVPEDGTSTEMYPIAKYTITNHLTEPLKGFVNPISSIIVPKKIGRSHNRPKVERGNERRNECTTEK
jgi:hypothetical protein